MSMRKKVGILGGSFDPVHFGHINLAIGLMEVCALDEVLFIPTRLSPFKENAPPTVSAEARLAMLEIALAPIKKFRVLDWEVHGQGPAYTIDTVRKLALDHSMKIHLLLGEDHLSSLHHWKNIEELLTLAAPLIGARDSAIASTSLPTILEEKLVNARVQIPLFDISSTAVRQRLAQKLYCGHLVPESVLNYIQQNHLYF